MESGAVRIAANEAEKEEIYRLRYLVYIEEMGGERRHTEANAEQRLLRDDFDNRAYHFFVRHEGKIVACGRHNLRTDGPLECEDQFEMKQFAPAFPDHISMTSRLALHPHLRGSHLLKQLTCTMYQFLCERAIRFDFLDCHPRLLPLYSRLGFQIYRPGFNHPKYTYVIPMVLVVNDLEHLERIKSPFVPIARRFPHSTADRDLLLIRFPDAKYYMVPPDLDPTAYWDLLRTRLLDPKATIERCDILAGLDDDEIKVLVSLGHMVAAQTGDMVLIGGDSGREIFLILEGSFRVLGQASGAGPGGEVLKILARGDIFGEVSFLTEGIRFASVMAVEHSRVLVLNAKALDHLTTSEPRVAAKLYRNMARIVATRLRDAAMF